jgi:nucleoside-diphosphate-sugar epimerase
MENVISACKKHDAKLVFFDNIYMYDPDSLAHMTEETPFRPASKKGMVRERVARRVLEGINKGELTALIARAPDFMDGENSVLFQMATKNLKAGKTANWQCALDKAHTFIYTEDAARATARLGNTPNAFNQTWHLPTNRTPRTGREWVELLADHLDVKPRVRVLPNWLMTVMGWFMPIMRELREMSYQYDRDYIFDSSKFDKAFQFKTTSYETGVQETAKFYK